MEPFSEDSSINPELLHQPNNESMPDLIYLPGHDKAWLWDWNPSDLDDLTLALYFLQGRPVGRNRADSALTSEAHFWWNCASPDHLSQRAAVLSTIERDIQIVLSSPRPQGIERIPGSTPTLDVHHHRADHSVSNEDSDIDEHGVGEDFDVVGELIKEFVEANDRSFLALPSLSRRERRHFHAVAHFLLLGHLTVGDGPERRMLISRRRDDLSWEVKARFKKVRRSTSGMDDNELNTAQQSFDIAPRLDLSASSPGIVFQLLPDSMEAYHSGASSGATSGNASADSGFSGRSGHSSFRRRRHRRQPLAFACWYAGCNAVFDRQCDLVHHERVHMPYDMRPHGCNHCGKRFLHPKDLRRYEKTHPRVEVAVDKVQEAEDSQEDLEFAEQLKLLYEVDSR